jgi:lipoprotein-anchoring transpeptidase ErfK/SrfK
MRKIVLSLAALSVALWIAPASAGQIKFSPDQFKVYGSLPGQKKKKKFFFGSSKYAALSADELTHKTVSFSTGLAPGSIIVRTQERKLFYVLPGGQAIQYAVGVGREGFTWSGTNKVTRKAEWPDWRPPKEMIEREARKGHIIPEYMPGGEDNPLGARAIYIGSTQYRIHGTTQPWSIGQAVSSGCIRMMNEEVMDLYARVQIGATVVVE